MNEVCHTCKSIIKPGESGVSMIKDSRKLYYHARCFASHPKTESAEMAAKKADIVKPS